MSPRDVARLQVRDVAQRQAERVVGLRRDAIGAPENIEVVDERRAHVDRERIEHARDGHAELLRLGAVDIGIDLRRARIEERERLREARRLHRRSGDRPRSPLERGQPAPGAILHVALDAAAGADARNGGRLDHEHEGFAQLPHLLAQIGEDAVFGQPLLFALLERLQAHEDDGRIGRVGEGCAVESGEGDGGLDAGSRKQDVARLAHDRVGALERRARRQLEGRDEIGAVELRDEPRRRCGEPLVGQEEKPAIDE